MVSPAAGRRGEVCLLAGKDEFLKREALDDLKSKWAPQAVMGLDFDRFDAERQSPAQVGDFLRTIPFGSPKRLAIYGPVEELEEADRETLVALCSSLPETAVLLLFSGESAKKSAFLRALSEVCRVVSCHPPFERDLPQWILARARKIGLTLEPAAAAVLPDRAGKEPVSLAAALDQLAIYVLPRKEVKRADVETLLSRSVEADVFRLTETLVEGKVPACLSIADGLFREGVKAFEIVAVMAGQIERFRKGARLLADGVPPPRVAETLGVPAFFSEKFLRQAGRLSEPAYANLTRGLLECDEAIKSGRVADRPAFDRFLVEAESLVKGR